MVNRGKSYGCGTCRQRKIKCSEERPECSQCVKSKRHCLGYPSKESAAEGIGQKSRNAVTKRRSKVIDPDPDTSLSGDDDAAAANNQHSVTVFVPFEERPELELWRPRSGIDILPTIALPMYPDTESLIFAYFKTNFFTPDPRGAESQLPGTEDCSTVLNQAILSLGTLSIANNHGSGRDVIRARHRYGIALRSANKCLKDPVQALHDDTLAAILILGIFECLDCWTAESIDQWSNHIRGAFEIIRVRERVIDPRMRPRSLFFFRIRALFTIICLFRGVPVPKEAASWSHEYDRYDTTGLPNVFVKQPYGRVIMQIADDLCSIQSAIRDGKLVGYPEILVPFQKIEESLGGWANPVSDPDHHYEPAIDQLDEPEAVWQGIFHVYKNHFTFMTLFHYRNVRIFNSLMLNLHMTNAGVPLISPEQINLMNLRFDLIDDIFFGIPWRLGYRKINPDSEIESVHARDNPPIMWGYTTMWGLVFACEGLCHEASLQFLASEAEECKGMKARANEQLKWARGRLANINIGMGIRQAIVFSDYFQRKWISTFPSETIAAG